MPEEDLEPAGTVIASVIAAATGAAFDADGNPLDANGEPITPDTETDKSDDSRL